MDLSELGLNQYMQPINSPITTQSVTPVSVDYTYDNSVGAASFAQGAVRVPLTIGLGGQGAYVKLDGPNNKIIVNDGTTNRIVIGSV